MNVEAANYGSANAGMLVLKLFLPAWNFFNDFSVVSRVEFAPVPGDETKSDWQPLYPVRTTTSWGRVIFNPAGNLELLEQSLLDRVATALREGPAAARGDFAASEAHELVLRIVRARLMERGFSVAGMRFRFRLVLSDPAAADEILFESNPRPLVIPVA